MSTVAKIRVPASSFGLRVVLEDTPARAELVRAAHPGAERLAPLVWFVGEDLRGVGDALERDGSVRRADRLLDAPTRQLYRIEWSARTRLLARTLAEHGATLLRAVTAGERWNFWLFFPTRACLRDTRRLCRRQRLPIEVDRVRDVDGADPFGGFELTAPQYEALLSGLESGYYDVPRGTNLGELAAEFDVSHQALSERFRRGHRTLVERALSFGADPT
ncbi:MAG: helix-turn-helix domain-containing protein [Salinigranum sp.]